MSAVSDFLEAVVTLLPREAGGRKNAVMPRDGSYRPFARRTGEEPLLRVRFCEGPPTLAPGDSARVILEVETGGVVLESGAELDLLEYDGQPIGIATVARVWRRPDPVTIS
jgi:hypothetical protein